MKKRQICTIITKNGNIKRAVYPFYIASSVIKYAIDNGTGKIVLDMKSYGKDTIDRFYESFENNYKIKPTTYENDIEYFKFTNQYDIEIYFGYITKKWSSSIGVDLYKINELAMYFPELVGFILEKNFKDNKILNIDGKLIKTFCMNFQKELVAFGGIKFYKKFKDYLTPTFRWSIVDYKLGRELEERYDSDLCSSDEDDSVKYWYKVRKLEDV